MHCLCRLPCLTSKGTNEYFKSLLCHKMYHTMIENKGNLKSNQQYGVWFHSLTPFLFLMVMSAPLSTRSFNMFTWPPSAAPDSRPYWFGEKAQTLMSSLSRVFKPKKMSTTKMLTSKNASSWNYINQVGESTIFNFTTAVHQTTLLHALQTLLYLSTYPLIKTKVESKRLCLYSQVLQLC